jgi:type IV secretory pathway VirB2 component (pilin)
VTSGGANPAMDDDDQPKFLAMIGLVALIVAVVILVFFGIGYLFGRAFL